MAAAFGIPVVVLFGPSDPIAWAPWRTANEVLVNKADIEQIPPEDVIRRRRPSEGARMSDLRRLLGFVKPYWSPLMLSVILMAIAGAAHAMMAVLIGPIFDRVLDPSSPERPIELIKLPFANAPLYLHQLAPAWIHNV